MSDEVHYCFPPFFPSDNPGARLGNKVHRCANKGWTYQSYLSPKEGLDAWFAHCRENHGHLEPPAPPSDPFTVSRHQAWRRTVEARRAQPSRQQQFTPQPTLQPTPPNISAQSAAYASPQPGPRTRPQSAQVSRNAVQDTAGGKYRTASDSDNGDWEDVAQPAEDSFSEHSDRHPRRRYESPTRSAGPSLVKTKVFPQGRTATNTKASVNVDRRPHSSSPDKRASTPMRIVSRSSSSCLDSDTDAWWYHVRGGAHARSFMSSEKAEQEVRALHARGIDAEVTLHPSLADVEAYMKSCTL
ncbi:hypothetical protein HDZ31DRAFT_76772 [Schizophyllum fasciatum]